MSSLALKCSNKKSRMKNYCLKQKLDKFWWRSFSSLDLGWKSLWEKKWENSAWNTFGKMKITFDWDKIFQFRFFPRKCTHLEVIFWGNVFAKNHLPLRTGKKADHNWKIHTWESPENERGPPEFMLVGQNLLFRRSAIIVQWTLGVLIFEARPVDVKNLKSVILGSFWDPVTSTSARVEVT